MSALLHVVLVGPRYSRAGGTGHQAWANTRLASPPCCRVLLKSWDYEVQEVNMVGTQPLPGLTYRKTFSRGGSKELPVGAQAWLAIAALNAAAPTAMLVQHVLWPLSGNAMACC